MADQLVWTKNSSKSLSKYFNSDEFDCPCSFDRCKTSSVSANLVNKLNLLREELGAPINVTSGYRCEAYQESLRQRGYETAKGVSTHELGEAADLTTRGDFNMLKTLARKYFMAVGIGQAFIHVDTREGKERLWSYAR